MIYTHRYIARVVLEATTALFVGSGETSLLKDALVQKDCHGFPMIPGTSIAGVLRHALEDSLEDSEEKKNWQSFFGYQAKEDGLGSKVKISSAYLVLNKGRIAEGLINEYDELLSDFEELPLRQHVRITEKGVADDMGLYDNEVVYKGCRFLFEIELKGDGGVHEKEQWQQLLKQLNSPLFRLGQGTRNGYGKLSVYSCSSKIFDLKDSKDFDAYLYFDPSLNAPNPCLQSSDHPYSHTDDFVKYTLKIIPDSFFLFGSGFGDTEVDEVPLQERIVKYDQSGKMTLTRCTVIPASSIKGAIRHRSCYHFNHIKKHFADKTEEADKQSDLVHEAIASLFGAEAGDDSKHAQRGRVIINDLYLEDVDNDKIFNHVSIDRFTGGAIDGALFSEKVSQRGNLELVVWLETGGKLANDIQAAFEAALEDICSGLLPLGGMTTKGNGLFSGKLIVNETEKLDYAN